MKVGVIASPGGHLDQAVALLPALEGHEVFFVVNAPTSLPSDLPTRTYVMTTARRDWRLAKNFLEAWRILRTERPDVLLSTGAGLAVPFALLAKLPPRRRFIFVETFAAVRQPTLTGRIIYRLADAFFYQWEALAAAYPKGVFGGPAYDLRDDGKP